MQMPDIELTLPARAENVAVVRHAIGGLGEALDVDPQTLSDVKLAVTEACTNVVVHAYDGGDGPMQVAAELAEEALTVVVRDEGRGIVPRADSPGLGLGLPLIATLTEALELGCLIDLAESLVVSARARTESRGAHFRDDHTTRDDANWMKHSLAFRQDDGSVRLEYKDVEGDTHMPMEPKY